MRSKEIDVCATDVDCDLGYGPRVTQVLRTGGIEAVRRKDQVAFVDPRCFRNEVREPRASRALSQRSYEAWDLIRRHLAKRDDVRIHARQPRRNAIEVGHTVGTLPELNVPTEDTQRRVCVYRLD